MRDKIKHLDGLARKAVYERDGGSCYICGGMGHDAAHLFVRNKLRTRWDLRNIHTLCRKCHSEDHNGSGEYAKMYINLNGQEAYDRLRLESNQMVSNTRSFMEQVEEELNDLVKA